MIREGQVVLFRFPFTDHRSGKLRPALVLRRLPGRHDDWLLCMISSQLDQAVPGLDEVIQESEADFARSGLKQPSLLRVCRLAVAESSLLIGALGEIEPERLTGLRRRLAEWLRAASPSEKLPV